jgi:hypothetical protein
MLEVADCRERRPKEDAIDAARAKVRPEHDQPTLDVFDGSATITFANRSQAHLARS